MLRGGAQDRRGPLRVQQAGRSTPGAAAPGPSGEKTGADGCAGQAAAVTGSPGHRPTEAGPAPGRPPRFALGSRSLCKGLRVCCGFRRFILPTPVPAGTAQDGAAAGVQVPCANPHRS